MEFNFEAVIDSSYLPEHDDSLAPIGSTLFGRFSYEPNLVFQIGASHYHDPGEAELSVSTEAGFSLDLSNRVTTIASADSGDTFTVQSFVSEFPNDWHIVLDLMAQDWLNGSNAMPAAFPDSFDFGYVSVYFTDEFELVRTIEATLTSITPAPEQVETVFAEVGTLSLDHNVQTVTLGHSFDMPVAFAFVATEHGQQPVVVRISDVSRDTLTLRLQEPNYLRQWHRTEEVTYVVVEAGVWETADGSIFEAGLLDTNQLFAKQAAAVTFQAEFSDRPYSFAQVQTFNGRDFVTTRQRDIDEAGLRLWMQEEEARTNGRHKTETLGWLAVESDRENYDDGFQFVAGRAKQVTHRHKEASLGTEFEDSAHILASLSSYAGHDPAWARGYGRDGSGFLVSVEEDKSADKETRHLPETIDYIAFSETGLLTGFEITPLV